MKGRKSLCKSASHAQTSEVLTSTWQHDWVLMGPACSTHGHAPSPAQSAPRKPPTTVASEGTKRRLTSIGGPEPPRPEHLISVRLRTSHVRGGCVLCRAEGKAANGELKQLESSLGLCPAEIFPAALLFCKGTGCLKR